MILLARPIEVCSSRQPLVADVDPGPLLSQIILQALGQAAVSYTRKNLRILYDALSTLADAVGSALADAKLLQLVMPPLLSKWQTFSDTDRELMPLLECFTSLATAIGALTSGMLPPTSHNAVTARPCRGQQKTGGAPAGQLSRGREKGCPAGPAFEEFAGACFQRCERIVTMQLQARAATAAGQPAPLEPEREFIICSLDLISGLAEGIGPPIQALVVRSQLNTLLLQCCRVRAADPLAASQANTSCSAGSAPRSSGC